MCGRFFRSSLGREKIEVEVRPNDPDLNPLARLCGKCYSVFLSEQAKGRRWRLEMLAWFCAAPGVPMTVYRKGKQEKRPLVCIACGSTELERGRWMCNRCIEAKLSELLAAGGVRWRRRAVCDEALTQR